MNAYKTRRPWVAAVITLILSPFFSLLYLGRGALALLWLVVNFLMIVGIVLVFPSLFPGPSSLRWLYLIQITFNLASFLLVIPIARSVRGDLRWPWYSRLPTLLGFIIAVNMAPNAIRAYLFRVFDVPTSSMRPTLDAGDYFFVDMRAFNSRSPERGDPVILRDSNKTFYIKRIVGLPGDRVQMVHGRLTVNGATAALKHSGNYTAICDTPCSFPRYLETPPNGHSYFILRGTEGNPSADTGVFVAPANSYFVLGDDRDISEDSRNGLGFVRREDLIGKPTYKFFNKFKKHWEWQPIR